MKKLIYSMVFSSIFINLWAFVTCVSLFRNLYLSIPIGFANPEMMNLSIFFIVVSIIINIFNSIIFVLGYYFIKKSFQFKGYKIAISYGIFLALIGGLIPLLRFFMTFKIPLSIFIYWIIDYLVLYSILGIILEAIYKHQKNNVVAGTCF